ncbi:MAG: hypothetical protein R6U96_14675 [Promethearchaeia archaeon]
MDTTDQGGKQSEMTMCRYAELCPHYRLKSYICNKNPGPYCGQYKRLQKKEKRIRQRKQGKGKATFFTEELEKMFENLTKKVVISKGLSKQNHHTVCNLIFIGYKPGCSARESQNCEHNRNGICMLHQDLSCAAVQTIKKRELRMREELIKK